MAKAEQYLKPEVIRNVARLDLRARFIVEGFLSGLHASPFHGFSVEFSEHRRYATGDDPKDIDWLVYAKTDRYYIKKYQAETNITGYLMLDLSKSMGYTFRQQLTKFEYSVSLAAALAYMMIHQQDPVGLVTFDHKLQTVLPAKSRRSQLAQILGLLAKAEPTGETNVAEALKRFAPMVRHRSLIMLFSDLLVDPPPVLEALRLLKHAGHDIILFHVLDEAEVTFPFTGSVALRDPETDHQMKLDASGIRNDYLNALKQLRENYQKQCLTSGIDYVPLDTSQRFDKALIEYLSQRKARF